MSNGITALQKVQLGIEATHGVSTDAATTVWVGNPGMFKDKSVIKFPEQKIGVLGGSTYSYKPVTGGNISLAGEATFEQLGYIFNCGIKTVASTADGAAAKVWTWDFQAVSTDPISDTDLSTLTVEAGDNNEVEEAHYGYVPDFTISGRAGEALMINANVETREISVSTDGFTSLATPTVEQILFSQSYLYIDDSTATPGASQVSATMLDMNLAVTTGWKPLSAKDNRTDFTTLKNTGSQIKLDITFEHNASASAEKAAWRAQTERVIRLKFLGTTIAGSTYTTKMFQMDLYGKWEAFDALGDDGNGDSICKGTFNCTYSPGAGKKAQFIVVNGNATLA